ncbi:pyruvate carboxylase [Bacillus safensis FO-36b] [Bacillus safensis subsp. safensis]
MGSQVLRRKKKPHFDKPDVPKLPLNQEIPSGTKQLLDTHGPEGLANWVKEQNNVLLTDTTFRDAHQSLLATRFRTHDLKKVAQPTAAFMARALSS